MFAMSLTVVKCGGAALAAAPFELERHVDPRSRALVVHGAGYRISAALPRRGWKRRSWAAGASRPSRRFRSFARPSPARTARLCEQIGPRAVGLMGDELGLEADRLPELGEAGMLRPVVPARLAELLGEPDVVPVIAPLARGPLNVNADDAAAVLAVALRADRLVFVSDVPGVLVEGEVVAQLSAADIGALGGVLSGGIVPKLQAALSAAREGVRVDGRRDGRRRVECGSARRWSRAEGNGASRPRLGAFSFGPRRR